MDILQQTYRGAAVLFWLNLDRFLTMLTTAGALLAGVALALLMLPAT